jgi:hypothetical protein
MSALKNLVLLKYCVTEPRPIKKQPNCSFSKLVSQRNIFIVSRKLLENSIIIYNIVSKAYNNEINVCVENFALNVYAAV